MRIIEAKGTPNGRRVRVFLAEKGITIEGVNIDLRAGANLAAEHRTRNPFGRIPVLELDDGTFIAESEPISAEWGQISQTAAAEALPLFDAALSKSKFLAGDAFTVTDITFGCALDFAQAVKVELPFDLPNIVRYRADLAARPSWAAR